MFRPRPNQLTPFLGFLAVVFAVTWTARAADLDEYYGFRDMEILKLDWELGPPLAVDLNGDGRNDLVVCNNRKARVELLLQKPDFDPQAAEANLEPDEDDINDLFGREMNWRFKRFQYRLNVKATSLVVGDFNHDQQPDLAYYSPDGLHIALQDRSATNTAETLSEPSWQTETRLDLRDGLRTSKALTAGDVNGDGRTDLVLLLQDGYYILLQTADGRMDRPVRHYSSSDSLKQIEIGDVDGDGRSDLVLLTAEHGEHPLRIRWQRNDGSLGPESRYHIPVPSVLRLFRLGGSDKYLVASVAEQSGRFSLHTFVQKDKQEEVISIHPLPSDDKAGNRDTITTDIDGDGLTDIVVTDPGRGQFVILRGQASGGLASPAVFPGLKDMRKVCAARLDDSARQTLVALSVDEKVIALSRFEEGRLSFPQTVAVTGEPQAMELADFDRDGQPDLAYVAQGPGDHDAPFFLRSILSVGRPTAQPGPTVELKQVEDKPLDLMACDIDHDGDEDLILVRSYDPLLLVRQTETGMFEPQAKDQTHIGLVSNLSPRAISLAPLGPNGKPALLVAQGDFARSLYFDADEGWQVIDQYQAGDRRHQFHVAAAVPASSGAAPGIVAYDDVSGIVSFVDPQTDGTYRASREIDVGTAAVRKILSGCFGAGSAPDIILCAERKLICIGTGPGTDLEQITGFESDIDKGRFGYFTVGDINGDGVPEIVVCEQRRNHVQILAFDENAELAGAYRFKVFETHSAGESRQQSRVSRAGEPRYALVEDVTGDGRNDLVLLVHDRIIVYPQD